MKPELEQQLIEKYPFLSRDLESKDENGRISNLYCAFGFEHGAAGIRLLTGCVVSLFRFMKSMVFLLMSDLLR